MKTKINVFQSKKSRVDPRYALAFLRSQAQSSEDILCPSVLAGKNEMRMAQVMKEMNWQGKFDELTDNLQKVKKKQKYSRFLQSNPCVEEPEISKKRLSLKTVRFDAFPTQIE